MTAGLDPAVYLLPLSLREVARARDLRRDVVVAGDVGGLHQGIATLNKNGPCLFR